MSRIIDKARLNMNDFDDKIVRQFFKHFIRIRKESDVSKEAKSLILMMLHPEPSKRPSISEILEKSNWINY